MTEAKPQVFWFGKHKGQPLADVPASYLSWVLTACKLSSGLRDAVTDELAHRGVRPPPPLPAPPPPTCSKCGPSAGIAYQWAEDRIGRRLIRRECQRCRGWMGAAPLTPENVKAADGNASPTALLDVLVQVEVLEVRLKNDGSAVSFATTDDWKKATPELRNRLRQCRHSLAGMLRKEEAVT